MGCTAPHDTALNNKDTVYMLEYVPHKTFLTQINVKTGKKQSVLLQGERYNNLSIIDNKAFVSVYREECPLGLEAGFKVDVYLLNGKKKKTIKLMGTEPTYIYENSGNIFINVRTLDASGTSGFLVYDKKTLKFKKTINLGRDFINKFVCIFKNTNSFYIIGNALVNDGKKLQDVATFFELNLANLDIKRAKNIDSPFEVVNDVQPLQDTFVATIYTEKQSSSIEFYSAQTLKHVKRIKLPFKPELIRVNQDQTLLALCSNSTLAIWNIKKNKIISQTDIFGIKDMQFWGDKLLINQTTPMSNGYDEEPQIQILDAHTLTEQHVIKGNFGHFALMFNP